jgi:hypothetical protein
VVGCTFCGGCPGTDGGLFFFVLLLFLWSSENKDGKLSKTEFSNLDTDGDGAVDRDELMAFMHKELGYEVCQGENSFAETVLRMGGDADHDGVLTWDEVQKMHRSKVTASEIR